MTAKRNWADLAVVIAGTAIALVLVMIVLATVYVNRVISDRFEQTERNQHELACQNALSSIEMLKAIAHNREAIDRTYDLMREVGDVLGLPLSPPPPVPPPIVIPEVPDSC